MLWKEITFFHLEKKGILWGTSHTLFPNPKYIMGVHVALLLSDVPTLLGQREFFLWRMYARLYVKISSIEEYLTPFLKVSDWYICCVCVFLISFSNQVTEKHKTPFITRIVLRLWSKFCERLELCCSSSILYNTTSMECCYSICFSEVCCWTSAENVSSKCSYLYFTVLSP